MKKICISVMLLAILASCQPQKKETSIVEVKDQKNLVVENIMKRRSIRVYKPEQISPDQLDTIIQCGINAPSAMNKQSWVVRIVQDPELIKAMNDGFVAFSKKQQDPNFSVFHGAPTVVLVAAQKNNTMSTVDCALLGENMVLAAESMGIGSCFIAGPIGYLNSPEAKKDIYPKLSLPDDYELLYTVSLGYKNENPGPKPRDAAKVQVIK